jgi:hypothetical protein
MLATIFLFVALAQLPSCKSSPDAKGKLLSSEPITFDAGQLPVTAHYTEFLENIRFIHLPLTSGIAMEDYYSDFLLTPDRIVLWSGTDQSMVKNHRVLLFMSLEGTVIKTIRDAEKDPFQPNDMVGIDYNEERDEFGLIDYMGMKLFRYTKDGQIIENYPLTFRPFQIKTIDRDHYAIYWFKFAPVVDHFIGIFSVPEGKVVDTLLAYSEENKRGVVLTDPLFRDSRGVGFLTFQSDSILLINKDSLGYGYQVSFGANSLPPKYHEGFSVGLSGEDWTSRNNSLSKYAQLSASYFSENLQLITYSIKKDLLYGIINLKNDKQAVISRGCFPGEYPRVFALPGDQIVFNSDAASFISDADSVKSARTPAEWAALMKKYPDYERILKTINAEENPVFIIGEINDKILFKK